MPNSERDRAGAGADEAPRAVQRRLRRGEETGHLDDPRSERLRLGEELAVALVVELACLQRGVESAGAVLRCRCELPLCRRRCLDRRLACLESLSSLGGELLLLLAHSRELLASVDQVSPVNRQLAERGIAGAEHRAQADVLVGVFLGRVGVERN